MLVAPCPHEERFAYAFYRSIERYFLQAAPSLPTQGFDIVDTCVVIGVAALCISACFFKSIWNAWLASTKNIENTNAAPIENRATCLYTETSLWLVMLTLIAHGAHQQSTYQWIYSRLCLFSQLICLDLARPSHWMPLRVPWPLAKYCRVETEIGVCSVAALDRTSST